MKEGAAAILARGHSAVVAMTKEELVDKAFNNQIVQAISGYEVSKNHKVSDERKRDIHDVRTIINDPNYETQDSLIASVEERVRLISLGFAGRSTLRASLNNVINQFEEEEIRIATFRVRISKVINDYMVQKNTMSSSSERMQDIVNIIGVLQDPGHKTLAECVAAVEAKVNTIRVNFFTRNSDLKKGLSKIIQGYKAEKLTDVKPEKTYTHETLKFGLFTVPIQAINAKAPQTDLGLNLNINRKLVFNV